MKTYSWRHAILILVTPPVIFLIWAVYPRSDPRLECEDITLELVNEHWTDSDTNKRRLVINCLLGGDWDGSTMVRIAPDYSGYHEYELEASLLSHMNKEQVLELLGRPDDEGDISLEYAIGMKPKSPLKHLLNLGWPLPKQYFQIIFDEISGHPASIEIYQ